jgi:taurine dioxygenase
MPYRHIAVHPTAGSLGAEISGVDLREALDDETFSEIHGAWLEHGVIFFRDQDLDADQHKAFAARFGPLQIHPYLTTRKQEGHPEIAVFESDASRPYVAAGWHSDMTFMEKPPSASVLRGIEVPPFGGDTLFASMAAAYDALSETFQRLLPDLRALHDTSRTFSRGSYPTPGRASAEEPPGAVHPVVRTHPETGRKVLVVNPPRERRPARLPLRPPVAAGVHLSLPLAEELHRRLGQPGGPTPRGGGQARGASPHGAGHRPGRAPGLGIIG